MAIVFIGMETSGTLRRRFQARGFETYSCDLLPCDDLGGEEIAMRDGLPMGRHLQGDVFETLEDLGARGLWPSLAIFHPTCTYLTNSAAWAFTDGPYHQKVKPGTLVGADRREARELALDDVRRIMALPIERKVIENPIGAISTRILPPSETVQPYEFGDDASKRTALWYLAKHNEPMTDMVLPRDPAKRYRGRIVNGIERWSNQTDSGQNKLTPSVERWKARSLTFPGLADAMVAHWSPLVNVTSPSLICKE